MSIIGDHHGIWVAGQRGGLHVLVSVQQSSPIASPWCSTHPPSPDRFSASPDRGQIERWLADPPPPLSPK
jgi:hypothetical protein